MGPENWRWADLADFFAGLGEDLLVAMGIVG
jgi:hypothetical protein